jgi:tRNA pseudouridine38-40 synthase
VTQRALPERRGAVLLTVAYDGTPFHGFASQPHARTVAGELLQAVRSMDAGVQSVRGASRTDAGVHARGQLVAFDTAQSISPRGWALGLSSRLPPQIAVRRAALAEVGLQPRAHAIAKHYRYLLCVDCCRDPFLDSFAWRLAPALDLDLARSEARSLIGTHDFAAFRSSADTRDSTVRTLHDVSIGRVDPSAPVVAIDVRGTAFLHNMVRIIVGSLVQIARGTLKPGTFNRALESLRRSDLGMTAPARGLCLESVLLDPSLQLAEVWPQPAGPGETSPNQAT